ncbi:hemagglutinin repeat-containing protein [Pseudomonas putida]|uniref:hemagglutinin repeat-containing protein n=1 Tax=Pseudomonas putida TaxID=303 RepID=UPI0018A9D8B2|nr:hemagglutinin repeat-containing protein [Pseudomonas putida]MBF8668252.1 hemagglutinin repeat-containing protein [Pseudomonas putida]MBF8711752.1 hemagglutinin repeat-containing protein [Pseudomonas putida]
MTIDNFSFEFSPQGKLRWAITSLLLTATLPNAMAAGVVVAPGAGDTAQLQTRNGVPIINIVAPNATGLSHNQYLDYNVDRQGLVLNNALQAGNSQLAGRLAANPQFQGRAASVILNEVVSRNPSAINGAQEIFGKSADYVLANPNGISVNGASFINTPNATLAAGRPDVKDGQLKAISALDASGQLQVQQGGIRNDGGAVNLIAPRIDSHGSMKARDALNITVGRQQVDYASGQVSAVESSTVSGEQRIDANLFGAMQAGRITIVSTAQGAGVNIGSVQIEGRDAVQIESAGDLNISGKAVENSLKVTRAGIHSSQGNVGLRSGQDLTLAAADVTGRDVRLGAGRNLTLTTVESRKLQEKREEQRNGILGVNWETYQTTQTDDDARQHGSQIVARRDALLSSENETLLNAASIQAPGQLSVKSGADLRISAATEHRVQTETGEHTKGLWKRDWDKRSEEQRSVTSQLNGGGIDLLAKDTVQAEGVLLTSDKDIHIGGKQIKIGTARNTSENTGVDTQSTFFGASENKVSETSRKSTAVNSELNAGGDLILSSEQDIDLVGTKATAAGTLNAHAVGDLKLSAAQDINEYSTSNNSLGFEGSASETAKQSYQYRAGVSYVREQQDSNRIDVIHQQARLSGGKVQLDANNALTLQGASVQSTVGDTTLTGKQVTLATAQDQQTENSETRRTAGGLYVTGGLVKTGGGVEFSYSTNQGTSDSTAARVSNVHSAGDLTISAESLSSEGAQVSSDKGLTVSALNVDNRAAADTKSSSTQQTTWTADVGINADYSGITRPIKDIVKEVISGKLTAEKAVGEALDGKLQFQSIKDVLAGSESIITAFGKFGMPNLGVDAKVGYTNQQQTEQSSTALIGQFAGQTVNVNVAEILKDQGTRYSATGGGLNLEAGALQANAASDLSTHTEQKTNANIDLRVYTKTGQDINVTGSVAGAYEQQSNEKSTAVEGGYASSRDINIKVKGPARFEGARFDGGLGGVTISSGELVLSQANNLERSDNTRLGGAVSLTFGTLPTGTSDLGGSFQIDRQENHSSNSKSLAANIVSDGPVNLNSEGGQTLQGLTINATGPITLKAGGALDFQAASDTRSLTGYRLGGGLNLGGKALNGEQFSLLGGNAGGNIDVGQTNEVAATLHGGELSSRSSVVLEGQSVRLQGTQVNAPAVSMTAGGGSLLLESAESTESRQNWSAELGAGKNLNLNAVTGLGQQVVSPYDFRLGAEGKVDYLQSTSHQNTRITADQIVLNSAGDAILKGATVKGSQVSGKQQNGLTLQDQWDTLTSVRFDIKVGLTGKPGEIKDSSQPAALDYRPAFNAQGEFHSKGGVTEVSSITDGPNGSVIGDFIKPVAYEIKGKFDLPLITELALPSVTLYNGKLNIGTATVEGNLGHVW